MGPRDVALAKDSLAGTRYGGLLTGVVEVLERARRASARSLNTIMTATYWEIGRRIVEFEQGGRGRAGYGDALLRRMSTDLAARLGRGFSERNLRQMRLFYLGWPIRQTASAESPTASLSPPPIRQTAPAKSPGDFAARFPLPWSHYVRLLSVESPEARTFYETEALRGGWSVRQLDRQISTLFYERAALSRNRAAMLQRGHGPGQGEFREPGLSGGGVCGMKVSPRAGGSSDRGGRAAR
jgi:hypothetical protein